ncbi:6-bladed beta-propeller [Bacteroidota bacterium]
MRVIYLIVFCFAVLCCQRGNVKTEIIDLDRNDSVSIFDLVDSISVIKLETLPECLIRDIYKICSYKNKLYIFDRMSGTVFCFDKNGKFLFKINKQGRGPDEYVYAEFINIDKFNDNVMILVPWGQILFFDLDGNFKKKIILPKEIIAYNEVYSMSKDVLLFLSNNEYRASYYSLSKDKIIKRSLKTTEAQARIMVSFDKTFEYNDSLYFNDNSINSKIINLSDTSYPIKYTWNFGKDSNTLKQINNLYLLELSLRKQKKRIEREEICNDNNYPNYLPFYSIESKTFRGISVRHRGVYKCVFYNKKTKKYLVLKETIEGNIPIHFLRSENTLINRYSDKKKDAIFKILNDRQKKHLQSFDPYKDNPILYIYHIK